MSMVVESVEIAVSAIDHIMDTGRKRHITGGILLSISLLFFGLAITTFMIKMEE